MKTYTFFILFAILAFASSLDARGQNIGDLHGINYQAVAIDTDGKQIVGMDMEGKPLYEKEIGIRFTIQSGPDGTILYQETHTTLTDMHGLFSLTIGKGNQTDGTYTHLLDIPWIDADQWLKVEMSLENDGNYRTVSHQQFMAVPYSFYTDDIADDAITTEKILDYTIQNQDIDTGSVDTRTILDETIINEDIATSAVDSRTILDETIINEDIATSAVDSRTLLDSTIINQDIATSAVDSRTILDETIINEDIASSAVDSRTLLDSTIINRDIATSAVDSRTILDETIINEDIATSAVDSRTLLDSTIINEDIASSAIDSRALLDSTIINQDMATASVDSRTIADSTVINQDVETGAIDSRTILDETIQNEDITDSTINLKTKVTDTLGVANGGTGLDASAITDGQILIGDGVDKNFKLSNLTAGEGVEITNGAGGITIASPPISTETSSDGSFEIPVGSNGTIGAGEAWYSPNSLKVAPPADKPFEMGDIFLASANVDLKGCMLSVYLESIDGTDGRANVQVVLFNPQGTPVTLQTPVTFKFLLVK